MEVIPINLAWTILIKLQERFVDDCLALGVQSSANSYKELIKVDVTVSILVKEREQSTCLSLGNFNSILSETNVELLWIYFPVSIKGIEGSERPAEAGDSFGASSLEGGFDLV